MSGNVHLFYLSFSKSTEEGGWQGFCIVEAITEVDAIMSAHRKGINPGGQVVTFDATPFADHIGDEWRNKLFTTEAEVIQFDFYLGGDGTIDKRKL